MRYYYVANPNRTIVKQVATEKEHLSLDDCYRILDAFVVENARFAFGGKQYTMVVDENGKLLDKPVNQFATYLYHQPFDRIAGTALIVKTAGWATFTEEQAEVFNAALTAGSCAVKISKEVEK